MNDLLFVYGTLMRAARNPYAAYLHDKSTFAGAGYFPGQLYQIDWYPGALFDIDSTTKVYGEVFRLHEPAGTLNRLDDYEDTAADGSGIFVRREVPVFISDNRMTCWVYLYNAPTDHWEQIESGDFSGFL